MGRVALTLLMTIGSCTGSMAAPQPPSRPSATAERAQAMPVPDDPDLRRGFEAWSVVCAPCHGLRGKGDGFVAKLLTTAPGDLTDLDSVVFKTDPERIQVIAEGIDNSPMIGWKELLTPEEIEAVNGYLRFLVRSANEKGRVP